VPFLKDIEMHLRFLPALPLLIAAELVVTVVKTSKCWKRMFPFE
jgi:hypothetical protein